jgi:hypothetical protein
MPHEIWPDFALPIWRRETQGCFSLKTPYCELVVRREHNTGCLYGFDLPEQKIVFDDYHEAQMRALLWTCYPEKDRLLRWYDPPQGASLGA